MNHDQLLELLSYLKNQMHKELAIALSSEKTDEQRDCAISMWDAYNNVTKKIVKIMQK